MAAFVRYATGSIGREQTFDTALISYISDWEWILSWNREYLVICGFTRLKINKTEGMMKNKVFKEEIANSFILCIIRTNP